MPKSALPLLVVDGYNVLRSQPRYERLVDEKDARRGSIGPDVFERARQALIDDVASFSHGSYEAVVVFDGGGNKSPDRPVLTIGGVRCEFSLVGQSADEVIERLVTEARSINRRVTLVTSDGTVRATAGFGPGEVTCVSSALLAHEMERGRNEAVGIRHEAARTHLTLEDRISPEQREKLWKLLGQ